MPRYLRIADIPTFLADLKQDASSKTPYQFDAWQLKWCEITDKIEEDVAVLSYRWRIRGSQENIDDYKSWVTECRNEGYATEDMRDGAQSVDWSLADGHAIQIEVAAWLLWLYSHKVAKYAWVDQMCVPQDADIEVKMSHIKNSPAIYKAGKVYVIIAPVVDYRSGRIMRAQDARSIVQAYNSEMDDYRSARFLSRSAVKALLVNNSYMRRVWTIQEAVAAKNLTVWPLKGSGEVASYQSIYVVDWPEFNAWNSHPALGPLYLRYTDEALNDYYEGDYTAMIKVLRDHPSDGIGYLAMISKDLMWITMDRNGLVNDLKRADTAARRAWVVLNNHQVQSARAFLAEDRVLALVPLVDYEGWKAATAGVPGRQMVAASVAWAYSLMDAQMSTWKWSIRVYNAPACTARGLDLLQPRRNLGNSSSMYGATTNWQMQIPTKGGTLVLTPPGPHPDPAVSAFQSKTSSAFPSKLELSVLAALMMPHPGQARFWGGGPWTNIRDLLQTDEVFRLSVQWALEPWRNPNLNLQTDTVAVVVVSGNGLPNPCMIIVGLMVGENPPSTGEVMMVVEVSGHLLEPLLKGLDNNSRGDLTQPLAVISKGVEPPPTPPSPPAVVEEPCDETGKQQQGPASAEGEFEPGHRQVLEVTEEPAEPSAATYMEPELVGASATRSDSARPSSPKPNAIPDKASSRPGSAALSATSERPPSAQPASAEAPSERPPSAQPPAQPAAAGDGAAAAPAEASEAPPAEVRTGDKHVGTAPVVEGEDGPCKGCIVS